MVVALLIAVYCASRYSAECDYWKNLAAINLNNAQSWNDRCKQAHEDLAAARKKIFYLEQER